MQTDHRALAGIRILDLSRVLAGPFCTQALGDLGADVIKVERPGLGDDTRSWGPPFTNDGSAAYYASANRNKRSITVDIKTETGREIVRKLARVSDILIENYKTGELTKLGLGYQSLSADAPQLIYCSITGFGQYGPRANEAGYDFLIQAMGGLISITGAPDGEGMKVGVAVADLFTGLWAAVAILAALQARTRSGRGQYIDLALFDCQLSMLANVASNWFISNLRPQRFGNAHPNIVPYQTFYARDGAFALAVGNDRQFQALCEAIDRSELATRFPTNAMRVERREDCVTALQQVFRELTRAEIIDRCQLCHVPVGPINSVDEAFTDAQTNAREMIIKMTSQDGVETPMIGSPIKFSDAPINYRYAPPRLGEHTDEVLDELGYSGEDRARLREQKII